MNTYVINYQHNNRQEDAYLYVNSFEEAHQKFQSMCNTGEINWELLERKPVLDEDANEYIEACVLTKELTKKSGGKV